jgi:NhaP-type Na+/H+ and K+/H+ antiporter
MAVRDGTLLQIRGDTTLQAGDEVIVLATDPDWDPGALFEGSLDRPAAEPG